jgi:hypothetical protein
MYKLDRESQVPPPSLEHKFASYVWYIYVCPKRTYSCMKRMRGQQVYLRERIPNAMFVSLSTYFYIGARMLNYSRKDVVYTNADERGYVQATGFGKITRRKGRKERKAMQHESLRPLRSLRLNVFSTPAHERTPPAPAVHLRLSRAGG